MRVIGNKDQDGKSVITASGTLSNGSVVTINSAGTVSIVSDTNRSLGDSVDPSGSGSTASSTSVTYDPDTDRFIVFYTDGSNSSYGTAVVGQVDGTTITFGQTVVFNSASTSYSSSDYDTNQNKVVVAYMDGGNSNHGYVVTGTVNATNNSIAFVTAITYSNSQQSQFNKLHFVSGQNKIVIAYKEVTNNSYDGFAVAGEVQANGSITLGTPTQFLNNTGSDLYPAVNSENNRIIFAYGYGSKGAVKCAELSGTNLTMNSSEVQFMSSIVTNVDMAFDSNRTRHLIAFRKTDSYGYVISTNGLTGSGSSVTTTFTNSTAIAFTSDATDFITISYNTDVRRFFVSYRDGSNNLQVRQGALWIFNSAPVIKLDHNNSTGTYDNIQIQTAGDDYSSCFGGGKIYTAYKSSNESSQGRSKVLQPEDKKIFPSPQQVISSTTGTMLAVIYDTTSKRLVYAYRDAGDSNKSKAVVATHTGGVSGITSVGTPVEFSPNQLSFPSMCFHPVENRVVICYKDDGDSGKLKAVAGAVDPSDNSIEFGTPIQLSNAASFYSSCCYVPTMNRVFACWRDENNSSKLYGTSINVSDKVCSIASIQNVANVASDYPICCYHPTQDRVVVHYRDNTNNNNYASVVAGEATRENGAVSFGTPVTVSSSNNDNCGICYDSTHDKLLLTYNEGSSAYGVVGTLSNVSFSFGTRLQYRSTGGSYNQVLHDPDSGKNIVYSSDSNTKIRYNIGTISGTAVSFTESADVTNGFNYFCDYQGGAPSYASGHVYNPDKKATVFCFETSGAGKTSILTIGSTSVTANNTLGFSDGDFADTTNATISTANAIIRNQTGLTAGQTMFVLSNGSISTTAGTPSITAGTAISSTELIVKG